MMLKAKENTANRTREGKQEPSAKLFVALTAIAVTGLAFIIPLYIVLAQDIREGTEASLYLVIATTFGAFLAFGVLLFQTFRTRKDKEDVLNAITSETESIVAKLEPLDDIKTTLASIARTQKDIEGILKEINAKI